MVDASGNEINSHIGLISGAAMNGSTDPVRIEQQFLNLFEQSPVAIAVIKGPQLVVTMANHPILELWGKGKEVINKSLHEVLPEVEGQGYFELLHNVRTTGDPFKANESEVKLVRNGIAETRYVNFLYQPYYESNGAISGVIAIAIDVTETVAARKKIEESETKLRNIVEQSPSPILILKGEELILEVANQPLFDLWDTGPEAIGKTFLEILPEMKDQVFEELLKGVLKTGETYYGYETPAYFLRSNGIKQTVYFNFIYQPYRQSDGRITGIIVLATDVTEQVKAKQELVQSEARNRLAVEAAQLGTYEIDLTTQTIIHNPVLPQYLDCLYQNKYPIMCLLMQCIPMIRKFVLGHIDLAKETGELLYEVRIIRPDKTIHWIRLNGKMILNNNVPSILIGTVLDITEEKKAAEILEHRIDERTEELLQSNAQLEKTNSELEQFAHISSHDLQEPLRKIRLFTNLIINQSPQTFDEGISKNLYKIKETAERMSSTLTALLNYTQLKKAGEFVEVDLNKIVDGVLSDVELIISEKKATISSETLPVIKGVPHQIQQLLYNLVNNALKFSKSDVAPVITIKANFVNGVDFHLNDDFHKECVEIIIQDNGVGFDQNLSEKIFGMFQRLHNKNLYAGTGIGLALCKKVVENHYGLIWATSDIGNGSKFHVLLPLNQSNKM
jgi:PAS domain S-box-containing protein